MTSSDSARLRGVPADRTDGLLIAIPADLVSEIRAGAVSKVEIAASELEHGADSADLHARYAEVQRWVAVVDAFDVEAGESVFLPADAMQDLALTTAEYMRDWLADLRNRLDDSASMVELFGTARRVASQGAELLALAEEAGWAERVEA